jgi:putative transcriptional regulator
MRQSSAITKGSLLLADPFSHDPYFKRSVILICEHLPEGSLGFIINKKLDITMTELVGDFPDISMNVYYGGPVATDTVHYIHRAGDLVNGSKELSNGIFWGGDFEQIKFLLQTEVLDPMDVRFYVGYVGWDEGQLNSELLFGSWITSVVDKNYIFNINHESVWQQVLHNKGNNFLVIGDIPDENIWN